MTGYLGAVGANGFSKWKCFNSNQFRGQFHFLSLNLDVDCMPEGGFRLDKDHSLFCLMSEEISLKAVTDMSDDVWISQAGPSC